MSKNRPVWYDAVMIGRALLLLMIICTAEMNVYKDALIMILIIEVILMMTITSIGKAYTNAKRRSNGSKKSVSGKSMMAKNLIVMLCVCIMAVTDWAIQIVKMKMRRYLVNKVRSEESSGSININDRMMLMAY